MYKKKKDKINPLDISEFEELEKRETWTKEDIARIKATVEAYEKYKNLYEDMCYESEYS